MNYTNKTQFLFRINKGTSDIDNTRVVNAKMPDEEKPMPFSHMIYIGDGMTDVPCLKVVSQEGGYGIAVYDPDRQKAREVSEGLLRDGRVHHTAPTTFVPDQKNCHRCETNDRHPSARDSISTPCAGDLDTIASRKTP